MRKAANARPFAGMEAGERTCARSTMFASGTLCREESRGTQRPGATTRVLGQTWQLLVLAALKNVFFCFIVTRNPSSL